MKLLLTLMISVQLLNAGVLNNTSNVMTRFKFMHQDTVVNKDTPKEIVFSVKKRKELLKSVIIPGWGQYDNGSKIKAGVFFAVEVFAIASYYSYEADAKDLELEFKDYADEHWDYNKYSNSITYEDGDATTACGFMVTHPMTSYRDHHYYENISKYDEFVCGWDDYNNKYEGENGVVYTPNKVVYIDMRTESNRIYRQATTMTTVLLFNHIFSALDAAIFGHENKEDKHVNLTSFSLDPLDSSKLLKLEIRF